MGNFADIMTKIGYSNDLLAQNAKKNLQEKGKYTGKVKKDANSPVDPIIGKMENRSDINQKYPNMPYDDSIDEDKEYE